MKDLNPDDYLTPTEFLQAFPHLKKMGFKKEDFGILSRLYICPGVRDRHRNTTLIQVKHLFKLLKYINENIEDLKFRFEDFEEKEHGTSG